MTPIRVLLVEDNPADADLTKTLFRRSKLLVHLDVAADGEEALERLLDPAKELPALVLLDLNLPRKAGHEVLAELRADPRTARLPVVVLTSSKLERDVATSYDLKANAYVVKPVGLAEFAQVVQAIEGFWLTVVMLPPEE